MKEDLTMIDSESGCSVDTPKMTNSVFSINKQAFMKCCQLMPSNSFRVIKATILGSHRNASVMDSGGEEELFVCFGFFFFSLVFF